MTEVERKYLSKIIKNINNLKYVSEMGEDSREMTIFVLR